MIRTHKFNNVKFVIDLDVINGLCDDPSGNTVPTIRITRGLKKDVLTLELLIHEALHASKFDETEKVVDRTAKDIASFLWRIGYRLCVINTSTCK